MTRSWFRFGLVALAVPLASGTAFSGDIVQGDQSEYNPVGTVIYWGGDLANNQNDQTSGGIGAGFTTALDGDLGQSGWIVSGYLGGGWVDGNTSRTDAAYGSLAAGYLWAAPDYYVSLQAGVHFVNNNESPGGGPTDGSEIGALFQYSFETTRSNAFYAQSYGSLSTAFEQRYAHVKTGYKTSTFTYGAEFTYLDSEDSGDTKRYGAFVGNIPIGKLSMTIGAGYQQESEPSLSDGVYGTVGFSVPFPIR